MSDERPRLRHGEKEYELLPPDARHAWLDPDADPALAPPPAASAPGPARTSTRRTIVVSCIAAFVAGIATFAVVRAVRDDDGSRRPSAAPATSAPARTTTPTSTPASTPTTRPRTPTTTAPATNRPGTSAPATTTPASSAPGATTAPSSGSRVVLGVTVSEGTDGVTIVSIASGSGADAAGLRPGDVFVSLDGTPIETTDDLGAAIGARRAGDRVSIVVRRNGADVNVTATLGTTTS